MLIMHYNQIPFHGHNINWFEIIEQISQLGELFVKLFSNDPTYCLRNFVFRKMQFKTKENIWNCKNQNPWDSFVII